MINAKVFLGMPLDFKGLCKVYPPLVKEVIGNEYYPSYKMLLTLSQEEIEDEYTKNNREETPPTPFEFLLFNATHDERVRKLIEDSFWFFAKTKISILAEDKKILLQDVEEAIKTVKNLEDLNKLPFLTEENYFDFQNLIRQVCGEKPIKPPNPNEPEKIRRMKAKARYRDKVKAKQAAKDGLTLGANLAAICCMGVGLNPLNIGEISYPCVGWLTSLYQGKEKYDIDIRSLQAGAKKKDVQPKYWISNLDN